MVFREILLVFVLLGFLNVNDAGYFDEAFATESINVPFGAGHLNVWEHTRTKGRYYVSPITALLTESAICQNNSISNTVELRFDLLMWSLEARTAVFQHIKTNINNSVSIDDIEPLPMERIRLVWRDIDRPWDDAYRLSQAWRTNTRLPSLVTFLILCEDTNACQNFRQIMQRTPGLFDGLELQYVIQAQKSARRTIRIQGKHIMNSRFYTRLNSQVNPPSGQVYLRSEDLKKIVSETVSSVVASVITDADFEMEDDFSVKDAITDILAQQRLSSREFTPHMWNSTFWDPVTARPDKTTKELNNLFSKDTSDSRYLTVNDENSSSRSGGGGGFKLFNFSIDGKGESTSSRVSKVNKEEVVNRLRERKAGVEWNGERFVVKPMDLYRLNTGELNTTTTIATGSVQIRKHEVVHHIRVNTRPIHNLNQTIRLSENMTTAIAGIVGLKEIIREETRFLGIRISLLRNAIFAMAVSTDNALGGLSRKMSTKIDEVPIQVSLVGGKRNSTYYSGTVQIMYYGVKGTICDDSFNITGAVLLCQMMGYRTGTAAFYPTNPFGGGSGTIWLDEVKCNSSHRHFVDCPHNPWGVHDCSHSKDVAIECDLRGRQT